MKYYGDNSTPYITFLRLGNIDGVGNLRGRVFAINTRERLAKRIEFHNRAGRNFNGTGGHDGG
jgi:hypothetical protein